MSNTKHQQPPKWADDFLVWYCDPRLLEEIQGDLHEAFHQRLIRRGAFIARFFFVLDVFRSISRGKIDKSAFERSTSFMILNSLHVAWRKMMRRKAFAIINVVGLAIGLAGALLIGLYVRHELSFDDFHTKGDRLYRVYCANAHPGGAAEEFPSTPPNLAPAVKQEIEEVEDAVRVYESSTNVTFRYDDKVFIENKVLEADSGFFNVFTASFIAGNKQCLLQPLSIVLTRSAAERYFGDASTALEKQITVNRNNDQVYHVTAVVEDFPENSHLRFDALLSIDYVHEELHPDNWLSHWPTTYILINENANALAAQENMRVMTERIFNPIYTHRYGKTYDEIKKAGGLQEYRLQPLKRVHLYSAHMGESGNIVFIYMFVTVAALLVFMAAFNYINLATARSAWEARSVVMRKMLGATRGQVHRMVVMESVTIALIASVGALVVAQMALTFGGSFLHQFIPLNWLPFETVVVVFVAAIFIGWLSGIIPSRLANTYVATEIIKGKLAGGKEGNRLRQTLVLTQFIVSMVLIMCTILIQRQLHFLNDRALGFDKYNLLRIDNVDKLGAKMSTLREKISAQSFAISSSLCYGNVGNPDNGAAFTPVELLEQNKTDIVIGIPIFIGDENYITTLGAKLVSGHPFPVGLPRENKQIILNESAIRAVGWQGRKEAEVVGKMIDVNGNRYELAGVVEDYNYNSMHEKIGPMAILSHYWQNYESLMVRIRPGSEQEAIASIDRTWHEVAPDVPFDYIFVEDYLDHLYGSDMMMGQLFTGFAALAICIACLGLFGLAMFSAERSVKEIGIRKVLGATVSGIVFRLSRTMMLLIFVAFGLATPIAWYLMNEWLSNFAYQTTIGIPVFAYAGGFTIAIAMLTFGVLALKAALANPMESLRHE